MGWIGVDLDGTLAHYDTWRGAGHIGAPVPAMLARVRKWLKQGRDVRIVTARVSGLYTPHASVAPPLTAQVKSLQESLESLAAIEMWCEEHLGQTLAVTSVKDFGMLELWDDRAVSVEKNTGRELRQTPRRKGWREA